MLGARKIGYLTPDACVCKSIPQNSFARLIRNSEPSAAVASQVGAQTETELKEKKLRVEDALNATKAAVSQGTAIGLLLPATTPLSMHI